MPPLSLNSASLARIRHFSYCARGVGNICSVQRARNKIERQDGGIKLPIRKQEHWYATAATSMLHSHCNLLNDRRNKNVNLRHSPFTHFSYFGNKKRFIHDNSGNGNKNDNDNEFVNVDNSGFNIFDQMKDMEKRQRFRNVFDAINIDPRVQMSHREYIDLCSIHGLNETECKELSQALHNAGLIWYFDGYFDAKYPLIIKTKEVSQKFCQTLDLNGELRDDFIAQKKKELEYALEQIAPLEEQYDVIRLRAETFSRRCFQGLFLYVTSHCMLVPYLTFWLLSWDIMEPVTYMFNLWTLFVGLWFWRKTGGDWTYDAIKETIIRLRHETLYKKLNFDIERYEALKEKIAEIEDDLINPEWQMLKSVHPMIPDTVKYVHLSPAALLEQVKVRQQQLKQA